VFDYSCPTLWQGQDPQANHFLSLNSQTYWSGMKPKYIIVKQAGIEVPLVFSSLLLHRDVAGKRKVKSAGFCGLDAAGKWIAGGKSASLGLSARPQDAEILNTHLGAGFSICQPTAQASPQP
jgi:hypothetical protein